MAGNQFNTASPGRKAAPVARRRANLFRGFTVAHNHEFLTGYPYGSFPLLHLHAVDELVVGTVSKSKEVPYPLPAPPPGAVGWLRGLLIPTVVRFEYGTGRDEIWVLMG